jgi:electron transfer flavoprotein alpha subunit
MSLERKIWVFCEQQHDHLARVGLELVSKANQLAEKINGRVEAVVLGHHIHERDLRHLLRCGADLVLAVDDPLLEVYQCDGYVDILYDLVTEHYPEILLLGATDLGLDLAPALAARLDTGLSAHCIDLDIDEDGRLVQIVPAYGQACVATILCLDRTPQMATVRPGSFPICEGNGETGQVRWVRANLEPEQLRAIVVEHDILPATAAMELESAEIVVAGGAGIGSQDGWQLVIELADALGGSVGATRPAVDEGWLGLDRMIGHSGRYVHPELYLGVGISGDMLHMVGMKDAHLAVAINKDPHAPIFNQVDYGIVGDYREIVPLLIRALKRE